MKPPLAPTPGARHGRLARIPTSGVATPLLLGLCTVLAALPAAAETTFCPLPWNANKSMPHGLDLQAACPYGYRLKGFDVTIPSHTRLISVESACVFWGVMPFLVIGFSLLDAAISAVRLRGMGTKEMSFLVFVGIMTGFNELVFKRLAMEPRPDRSCNHSCGFPSGHSMMSCGFFMLMFLDAVFRTMPRVPLNLADAREYELATSGRKTIFGWTLREIAVSDFRAWATFMPLSRAHTLNQADFCCFALAWGVLLLPVPFSRLVLNDHTPKQVLAGSALGMFEAMLYFGVIRSTQQRCNHLLGRRVLGVFVHDFPLPVYEAISKCFRLLARSEEVSPDGKAAMRGVISELGQMHRELTWYMKELEPTCVWASFDEDSVNAARERARLQRLQDEIGKRLEVEGVILSELGDDDDDPSSGVDSD